MLESGARSLKGIRRRGRGGMLRFLSGIHERGVFLILAVWLGLICIVWSMVAGILYPLLPRQLGTRVGQSALMFCFRIYLASLRLSGRCYCDLTALDALREDGRLVIAPNHPALIDVLLITSRLPRITCIMKAELWGNLFLGGSARLARFIGNDAPRSMVKQSIAELGRGSQLLIFPEGTRTVQQPVNPFKGGFALIAKQAGVPIQTVFIETNSPYLSKGWPIFRMPELPLYYRVRLGRRFTVTGNIKVFNRELEEYFAQELSSKQPEWVVGRKPPLVVSSLDDATGWLSSIFTRHKAS